MVRALQKLACLIFQYMQIDVYKELSVLLPFLFIMAFFSVHDKSCSPLYNNMPQYNYCLLAT